MKYLVILLVAFSLSCDSPTEPYMGRTSGGSGGAEKEAACLLAEDMMLHPAAYDSETPSEAHRHGLDLWNEWKCDTNGLIRSSKARP